MIQIHKEGNLLKNPDIEIERGNPIDSVDHGPFPKEIGPQQNEREVDQVTRIGWIDAKKVVKNQGQARNPAGRHLIGHIKINKTKGIDGRTQSN